MPESNTIDNLTAAQKRSVLALRRPVLDASRRFGEMRERLSELAPKIVRLFNTIVADNERFTFVEFARLFDNTIPTHAADRDGTVGYRNHRTYYTMVYMRRLITQQATGRRRQQGVRDTATDALARTIATILQIVEDQDRIWTAIQQEFQFGERIMTRLRKRVDNTKPLIKLDTARPAKIGNVIHMEREAVPAAEEAEPMRQAGRNVTIPAAEVTRTRKRAA